MRPGTRVRVTGGPWERRIGQLATVVVPPDGWGDTYPVDPRDTKHVLLLMDDEHDFTLHTTKGLSFAWSCRMAVADLEAL